MAKRESIPVSLRKGGQLDNSSVLSPRLPSNPNPFKRSGIHKEPSAITTSLDTASVADFLNSMKLVKSRLDNPTPSKLLDGVDSLPPFELMRGTLQNGDRSLDYVVQDLRGLCYTVNFSVLSTKQPWTVFVPTDEMIVEMLRVWGKKKYAVRMRKFSAWLVASMKIEFHHNTNIIKSAVLQREIFQNLLLNELSNVVHAASVHIQKAMRRFKANKEARAQAAKDEKIKKSRMTAMERVKAREQQLPQPSDSQRRHTTRVRLTSSVSDSADDLPLLRARTRYYSSGYVARMHKAADAQEVSFRPPPIVIPSRPGTTADSLGQSHQAPRSEEERRIALEEEMNHLRHELEMQRNQMYYARGSAVSHHGSGDGAEQSEEGADGVALSPRKASLLNNKNLNAKEMKQLKTDIDQLQRQLLDVSEVVSTQRQEALQAVEKAEEEIVQARQQAEKIAVETAEKLKQEAIEMMKTQLQAKEQHTTKLLQRQRVLEQQREEKLRKDMEERYKELEQKLLADAQAAQDRQDLLRNQLADLKKHQQRMETKRKTHIRRETNSILDDDQSLSTMLPPAKGGHHPKFGVVIEQGGKVTSPRQLKKPAPSAKNIDISKRAVNLVFDESEEEEVDEEEDDALKAQREQQRQLMIVQQLNRAVEQHKAAEEANKKRGWMSWLFAKKEDVAVPAPAPMPPAFALQPAPSGASLGSRGMSATSGSIYGSVGIGTETSYAKSVMDEASGVFGEPVNMTRRKTIRKKPNPEKEKMHAMAKRIQQLVRRRISRKRMALNKGAKHLRKKALFEIIPYTADCAMFNSALQTAVELDQAKLMKLTLDRLLQLFDEYDYKDEALPMHLSELTKAILAFNSEPRITDKGLELLHKIFKMKPVLMSKQDVSEILRTLLFDTLSTHLDESILILWALRLLPRLSKRHPDVYCSLEMLGAIRRVFEKYVNSDLDILDRLLRYVVIVASNRQRQERLGQAQIVECVFMSLLHNYTKSAPLVVMHCRALQNLCAEDFEANQAILGRGMYPHLFVQSIVAFKSDSAVLPEIISAVVSVYANCPKNKPKFLGAAAAEVLIDLCAIYAADDKVAGCCLWALSHLACSSYKPQIITKIMKALKQYATGDYSAIVQDEAHRAVQRFMMGLNARPNTPVPVTEPIVEPKAAQDIAENGGELKLSEEQQEEESLDAELNAIHAMHVDDGAEYDDKADEEEVEDKDLVRSAKLTNSLKNALKSNKMLANAHLIAMGNSYMYSDEHETQ
eukprot:gene26242-31701_t